MVGDVVDLNESINGHTITVEWLLKSLRENDKYFRKFHSQRSVKKVTAVDVSGGEGILSEILRCTVTFTDTLEPSDVYTTIIKIPGITTLFKANNENDNDEEMMEKMTKPIIDLHNAECEFYNILAPILDVPVPKVYKTREWIFGKQTGCIHMEDLTARGKTLLFFEDVNLCQVKNVIKHIAHMHKNILVSHPVIWKGKFVMDPDSLENFLNILIPTIDVFIEKCKHPEVIKPMIGKLRKFITNTDFYRFISNESNKTLKLLPVIAHGDIHLGNIMWTVDSDGNIQDEVAAFLDWQVIHEDSPMSDLGRFLTMGASGKIRREAESFAIKYYLECLTNEFDGDKSKVPYTTEKLRISYNYTFLNNILFLISSAVLFLNSLEENEFDQAKKDTYFNNAELKIRYACEDAIQLLEGEMKDLFERFGV